MAGPLHRQWMYKRRNPDGVGVRDEWVIGVNLFDEFAQSQEEFQLNGVYRCPCVKCKNMKYYTPDVVKAHLYRKGFMKNYWYWTSHGEQDNFEVGGGSSSQSMQCDYEYDYDAHSHMENMVHTAFQSNDANASCSQDVNPEAFYSMLESAQTPLYDGCNVTELETSVRLLSIKAEHNMSQRCFNEVVDLMKDTCPPDSRIPRNYHQQLRKVKDLGMDVQEIDCCPNGCMLYYKDDEGLSECKFCGHARRIAKNTSRGNRKEVPCAKMHYLPLIPRLQRLYASQNTAAHMRWHEEHRQESGVMRHPSDALAWKHFNQKYPDFAAEPRNVRLGLCADGFTPFSLSGRSYSVWPVVVTPYNLPPDMCMTTPYMFLSCMVPGPSNPKNRIDVYLQPLIDELKLLWDVGVDTFDVSRGETFKLRAALMWTINDFPAYGMLSGWSTHGKMACPICMDQNPGFQLQFGRKPCWFDCHRRFLPRSHPFRSDRDRFRKGKTVHSAPPRRMSGETLFDVTSTLPKVTEDINIQIPGFEENQHNWTKRSIFWDLPYWKHQLLRHNLDVMHIEKNFSENIINTVMDVPGKTKDDINARMDMAVLCNREELNLTPRGSGGRMCKPKAKFALTLAQKRAVCQWLREVHVPDGYCSNVANWVDPSNTKFQNMKSHDHHVFLENLLPVAFADLPADVLGPLVELSEFFRNLCSAELNVSMLEDMNRKIAIILCKLEAIFPPGFWNVMEHLPVHLAEEALLGGPVQYRWMYPFERYFGWLKPTAKNKARVEASMVQAYLAFEIKQFAEHYFQSSLHGARVGRNQGVDETQSRPRTLSVFHREGTPFGRRGKRYLTEAEYHAARLHILLNCDEVQPYLE